MADRPNVLFVLTDQQHAWAHGAANPEFDTPNLDRLADRGVRFTNAHCPHPQCSPSRAAMVTGKYPHQVDMPTLPHWKDVGRLDPDAPSVGRAFRDAGYDTAWFGKWHLGDGNGEALGWDTFVRAEHNRAVPDAVDDDYTYGELDDYATDHAVDYLADAAGGDDPFFATLSLNLPHPPFYEVESCADRYDADATSLPVTFADDPADKPPHVRDRIEDRRLDAEAARRMRYQYQTMTSKVDDCVGRVLDVLREAGVREDTVVVFTSDHGDMQGAHGMDLKGVLAFDELLRVPLVVDAPGLDAARETVDDLVALTALPGTLCDAAGVDADFEGGSLLPACRREGPPADDRVFFEHKYAYWGEHPYRGVRTRDWKYVEYVADGEAELYDVTADPLERRNRAGDPDCADARERCRRLLEEWWAETDGTDEWAVSLDA